MGVLTAFPAGQISLMIPLDVVGMTYLNFIDETIMMVLKLLLISLLNQNANVLKCSILTYALHR